MLQDIPVCPDEKVGQENQGEDKLPSEIFSNIFFNNLNRPFLARQGRFLLHPGAEVSRGRLRHHLPGVQQVHVQVRRGVQLQRQGVQQAGRDAR